MEMPMILLFATTLLVWSSPTVNAQKRGHVAETPSPAPAPAPAHVNLTELLSVAGPFHTFLDYLETTKVLETFQNQANNSDEGITIFVPKDSAFSSLKKPSLSKLTSDQLKQLCLFHALPHYYSLSDFRNLSEMSPVPTLAGGDYTLNFTDVMGTPHLSSGWSNTKISSSVFSTSPVALYQVNKVLLPEAIFGTDIPPTPAPAPAPEATAPAADSPDADVSQDVKAPSKSKSEDSKDSASSRVAVGGLVSAIAAGLVFLL